MESGRNAFLALVVIIIIICAAASTSISLQPNLNLVGSLMKIPKSNIQNLKTAPNRSGIPCLLDLRPGLYPPGTMPVVAHSMTK
jgi:hypothetical protein